MSLFSRIANRIKSVVTGNKPAPTAPDLANPPGNWLPMARPAIRRRSWFLAVVKQALRRADVSKTEKRQLRKNLLQGHWAPKSRIPQVRRNAGFSDDPATA